MNGLAILMKVIPRNIEKTFLKPRKKIVKNNKIVKLSCLSDWAIYKKGTRVYRIQSLQKLTYLLLNE